MSTLQILLEQGGIKLKPRRTTIDDHTDAAPVRFPPRGHSKQLAERICHAASLGFPKPSRKFKDKA